jgi:hypothetical protein
MEIWKDIPDYEGIYQISNLGNIKSLSRKILNNGGYFISKEKLLNPSLDINGYFVVCLCNNKKQSVKKIHQLLAMCFLEHKTNGHTLVVDHINNNPSDNRLENLQIITNRENLSKDKKKKTSKYTGVSWDKSKNKWVSQIIINSNHNFLGRFNCELSASIAYQNKLKTL